jgi:hypothetical protein
MDDKVIRKDNRTFSISHTTALPCPPSPPPRASRSAGMFHAGDSRVHFGGDEDKNSTRHMHLHLGEDEDIPATRHNPSTSVWGLVLGATNCLAPLQDEHANICSSCLPLEPARMQRELQTDFGQYLLWINAEVQILICCG